VPLWSEIVENKIVNFATDFHSLWGRDISGLNLPPLQKQLKAGVYIPTGAQIKRTLFAVKYRSDGPENIFCVTPFDIITVI
jgi:hypothetical protein